MLEHVTQLEAAGLAILVTLTLAMPALAIGALGCAFAEWRKEHRRNAPRRARAKRHAALMRRLRAA